MTNLSTFDVEGREERLVKGDKATLSRCSTGFRVPFSVRVVGVHHVRTKRGRDHRLFVKPTATEPDRAGRDENHFFTRTTQLVNLSHLV